MAKVSKWLVVLWFISIFLLVACGDSTSTIVPVANTQPTNTARATTTLPPTLPVSSAFIPSSQLVSTPALSSSAGFKEIFDLSFLDNLHGWALGTVCGQNGKCILGLSYTEDGGNNWQSLPPVPPAPAFKGDTPDKNHARQVFFSGPLQGFLYNPGFYSTRDGGKTWQDQKLAEEVVGIARAGQVLWAIARTCAQPYSDCNIGLLISVDFGRTWTPQTNLPQIIGYNGKLEVVNNQQIFLLVRYSSGSRLFASSNGGKNWQELHSPCPTAYQLATLDAQQLWLICDSIAGAGNQAKFLFKSNDGGKSWQELKPRNLGTFGYVHSLAITAQQTLWLSLDRSTLLKSSDGGINWQVAIPYEHANPLDGDSGPVVFTDANHGWVATQNMVFYTVGGGDSWQVAFLGDYEGRAELAPARDLPGVMTLSGDAVNWRSLQPGEAPPSFNSVMAILNRTGLLKIEFPSFNRQAAPAGDYKLWFQDRVLSKPALLFTLPGTEPQINSSGNTRYVIQLAGGDSNNFLVTCLLTVPGAQNGGTVEFWWIDPVALTHKLLLAGPATGGGRFSIYSRNNRWLFWNQSELMPPALVEVGNVRSVLVDLQSGRQREIKLSGNNQPEVVRWEADGRLHYRLQGETTERVFDPEKV